MTKAALAQLSKTLAVEWARDNIQVNCLAPGFIKTPLTEKGLFGDPKITNWIIQRVPARRPGTPEDMVGLTLLLSSRASDYLTGQLIAVDGGFLAGGSWTAE
jgi:NAD(P)-dependent dehydrogenase (short-subunit alcohol dehydrogenase family)